MLDPIVVQKSLDERLAEYSCIFSATSKTITASDVRSIWSDFVELAMKKYGGWQALWKIPRATCENLDIDFPTRVIVEVEEVNCSELSALVTILAVEDNIELPDQHEAMLFHLYPTVQQRDSLLCIEEVAQCVDTLRFFYSHIWQPWDDEDDRNENWATHHLEPRMKLFRDMQAGVLSSHTISHIRSLLQEARSLYKRKVFLEVKNQKQLPERLLNGECSSDSLENCVAIELMELKPKWNRVLREIEMIENPLLREKVIERRQKGQTHIPVMEQYFVVWNGGNLKEHITLMSEAHSSIPETATIMPCSLPTALNLVEENGLIFLCQGIHKLNDEMILMRHGTVKGFPSSTAVTLSLEDPCAALIDWGGTRLMFSNICFTAPVTKSLVIVRNGVMNAKSCQFLCDPRNSTVTGVCVLPGGAVELMDCDLSGFDAAIAVHSGATLSLVHCRIASCAIGVQVYDGAELYLKDCLVENCKEYGIVLRTFQNDFQDTVGSLQLFERYESIVVDNCKMRENTLGDVLVSPMPSSDSFIYEMNMESEDSSIAPVSNKSDADFEDV